MRGEIPIVVIDQQGLAVTNASVSIYLRATTNLAPVYLADTGVTTVANPIVTNLYGRVEGWLERGAYTATVTATGLATYNEYLDIGPTADGGIDSAWIATDAITTPKIASGAVTVNEIADGSVTLPKLGFAPAAGGSGLLSARSIASAATNAFYWATDQQVLYFSNGSTWLRISAPAGVTELWFGAAAPAGYMLYDGTDLPASTGIYADLFSHLGGLTTPNTKGKVPVMRDAAQAEFDTLRETGGAKTHVLTIPEMPSHVHYVASITRAVVDPTNDSWMSSAEASSAGVNTAPAGGNGAHNNLQPYIVCHLIGKL